MIYLASKRTTKKLLLKKYPNADIFDVTSRSKTETIKLSPFYPHGDIPIPFSEGTSAMSVEGIWQGLKVFANADIDHNSFANNKMKNIKRTVKKFGAPLGHRKGVSGSELLNYFDARVNIYLPAYLWVLKNKVHDLLNELTITLKKRDIVLLDYETNDNIFNLRRPLSHAFLIKKYLEGDYPEKEALLQQTNAESGKSKNSRNKSGKVTTTISKKSQTKKAD